MPESAQVAFLFSRQHGMYLLTIISCVVPYVVYSTAPQCWQITIVAAICMLGRFAVTIVLRRFEKGYTFFDIRGINTQFNLVRIKARAHQRPQELCE
jgi:hypothetical protein